MNGRAAIGFLQRTRLSKSVAGGADVTLTAAEAASGDLQFTGALSANINVLLPSADFLAAGSEWSVENACTGAAAGGTPYYITFKGPTGTGPIVTQGQRIDAKSDGTNLVPRLTFSNLASQDPYGAAPLLLRVDVPAGATGNLDTILPYKIRVIDVWLVKQAAAGGGAGTIQVLSTGSAITDAISINIADKTIARAGTIDDANYEIAAGGTLRITRTRTASTDETCVVYILAARVP